MGLQNYHLKAHQRVHISSLLAAKWSIGLGVNYPAKQRPTPRIRSNAKQQSRNGKTFFQGEMQKLERQTDFEMVWQCLSNLVEQVGRWLLTGQENQLNTRFTTQQEPSRQQTTPHDTRQNTSSIQRGNIRLVFGSTERKAKVNKRSQQIEGLRLPMCWQILQPANFYVNSMNILVHLQLL